MGAGILKRGKGQLKMLSRQSCRALEEEEEEEESTPSTGTAPSGFPSSYLLTLASSTLPNYKHSYLVISISLKLLTPSNWWSTKRGAWHLPLGAEIKLLCMISTQSYDIPPFYALGGPCLVF